MQKPSDESENLRQKAINYLTEYDNKYRIESKHISGTVIPINNRAIQFSLDGGRNLAEIDIENEIIIDNEGYNYSLEIINTDQLIKIVDIIKETEENYKKFCVEQLAILEEIQRTGHNIVTCGNCGGIILHKTIIITEESDHTLYCGHCDTEMEECDCPDLYY